MCGWTARMTRTASAEKARTSNMSENRPLRVSGLQVTRAWSIPMMSAALRTTSSSDILMRTDTLIFAFGQRRSARASNEPSPSISPASQAVSSVV